MDLELNLPEKLQFLFKPHRGKVLWGGRGGIKSWSVARALLMEGEKRKLRIAIGRETMVSIKESVHELLSEQIPLLGLSHHYRVLKREIVGKNGTRITFHGLREMSIHHIKSLEAVDIFWAEEAQNITKQSWLTVLPTIRKKGSEIWVTFNPQLESDPTYKMCVLAPPPGWVVVKTSWRDNLWLTEELRIEKDHLELTDPLEYQHVWEGQCKSAVTGAIYAEELKQAEAGKRIGSVPYDRTRPVHTFWDLGYGDKTSVWFVQAVDGWYHFIDYMEGTARTIQSYLIELQQRGYVYGYDWLPHDAVDAIIHGRLAQDKTRSIEMLMRAAGRKVHIAPKLYVHDGINAARTIFPQCRFDRDKCMKGLDGLRQYQMGPVKEGSKEKREPLHDKASHPADAFRTAAVALRQPTAPVEESYSPPQPLSEHSWMA